MYENIALFAILALAYSAISRRIDQSWVTGPIIFIILGLIVGPYALGLLDLELQGEGLRFIAEITLALVLFNDAGGSNLKTLSRIRMVPMRMLVLGLPLTIAAGFLVGEWFFPHLYWIELALLATLLAPTDAALGKGVVNNTDVPADFRSTLNAESGLNDGLAVPFLLFFLELARGASLDRPLGAIGLLILEEVGIGVLVGGGLVTLAAGVLRYASARQWIATAWAPVPVIALAIGSFVLAQLLGGSGFIAAFVGGLTFSYFAGEHKHELLSASEGMGELLAMITWIIFGAVVIPAVLPLTTLTIVLYAILSLTVIRMLPISVSLLGSGVSPQGSAFLGWFGPRGLATIVFVVMVADENLANGQEITVIAVVTVIMSIIAHGMSANVLARKMGVALKM